MKDKEAGDGILKNWSTSKAENFSSVAKKLSWTQIFHRSSSFLCHLLPLASCVLPESLIFYFPHFWLFTLKCEKCVWVNFKRQVCSSVRMPFVAAECEYELQLRAAFSHRDASPWASRWSDLYGLFAPHPPEQVEADLSLFADRFRNATFCIQTHFWGSVQCDQK